LEGVYCSNFCIGVIESTVRFQFFCWRRSDSSLRAAPVSVSMSSTASRLLAVVSSICSHWFQVWTIPTFCVSPAKSCTTCDPIGVPLSSPLKKCSLPFLPVERHDIASMLAAPRGPASRICDDCDELESVRDERRPEVAMKGW
jgi:hypothetical protein